MCRAGRRPRAGISIFQSAISERTLSDLQAPAQPIRLLIRTTPGTTAGKLLTRLANAPARPVAAPLADPLNEREQEILRLMTHGLNNAEIARRMFLSEGTVRNYASAIFSKLGVEDRLQAVVLAIKFGLGG